jgi:hypothetical protein
MPTRNSSARRSIAALCRGLPGVLLAVGVIARLAPLLDPAGRGLRQFPTEDGYLMLTIARNIALGRGMSIAEGTIPTNGAQPLMAWVYAALFWIVDGDRVWGVWLAQALQVGLMLLACFLLFGVAREMLKGQPHGERVAALTATLWFAGPLASLHGQNCLETGPYALACLGVAACWLRLPTGRQPWPFGRCVLLGLLLALAFWVRNDAALLVGAVCLARVLPALGPSRDALWRRGSEAGIVGSVALAGALPWLFNNKLRFGYWMPISGVSEGLRAQLGENLVELPAPLAEYSSVILQIPLRLEEHVAVLVGGSLVVLIHLFAAWMLARRLEPAARSWFGVVALWMALFVAFYGIRFGVGFFISRYFFPLSPYLALVTVYWIHRAWRESASYRPPLLQVAAPALILALVVGLNARQYLKGREHNHFQVVEWVTAHVPDDVWVGAVQTGTLGFFHDRTINLDGKVNPYALRARIAGRAHEYVPETPIEYLADWPGIVQWLERPGLRGRFELLVEDRDRRLAVLRRTEPPPASASPSGGLSLL